MFDLGELDGKLRQVGGEGLVRRVPSQLLSSIVISGARLAAHEIGERAVCHGTLVRGCLVESIEQPPTGALAVVEREVPMTDVRFHAEADRAAGGDRKLLKQFLEPP